MLAYGYSILLALALRNCFSTIWLHCLLCCKRLLGSSAGPSSALPPFLGPVCLLPAKTTLCRLDLVSEHLESVGSSSSYLLGAMFPIVLLWLFLSNSKKSVDINKLCGNLIATVLTVQRRILTFLPPTNTSGFSI